MTIGTARAGTLPASKVWMPACGDLAGPALDSGAGGPAPRRILRTSLSPQEGAPVGPCGRRTRDGVSAAAMIPVLPCTTANMPAGSRVDSMPAAARHPGNNSGRRRARCDAAPSPRGAAPHCRRAAAIRAAGRASGTLGGRRCRRHTLGRAASRRSAIMSASVRPDRRANRAPCGIGQAAPSHAVTAAAAMRKNGDPGGSTPPACPGRPFGPGGASVDRAGCTAGTRPARAACEAPCVKTRRAPAPALRLHSDLVARNILAGCGRLRGLPSGAAGEPRAGDRADGIHAAHPKRAAFAEVGEP